MQPACKKTTIRKRILRYALLGIFAWSGLCATLIVLNIRASQNEIFTNARIMAQISIDKDIAYRHWAAQQGGVYVPISKQTQPNPYLKVPERDIVTVSGWHQNLINPAYMTRQVFEQKFPLKTSLKNHITSLKLLRSQNAPDDWEVRALQKFAAGVKAFGEPRRYQGEPTYRFMRPLRVEQSCLLCHRQQGYRIGDVRGGISVIVPLNELEQAEKPKEQLFGTMVGLIWFFGLCGIGFGWWRMDSGAKALQRERDSMQLLFEAAPNGMLLFNRAGEIVLANEFFRENFAQTESVIGKNWDEITHCDNAEKEPQGCGGSNTCQACPLHAALQAAFEYEQETESEECRVAHPGYGEPAQVFLFNVTPLQFDGKESALVSLSDISFQKQAAQERERMRLQLVQAQKVELIGRLTGGIAHDFNNMLAAILGNVELALHRLESTSKAKEYLLQIKDVAKRSAEMTRQLLGFARKQTIEPQIVNLNQAVEGMLKILERLLGEDVSLVWKPVLFKVQLMIDPAQLTQILTNLAVNARDAITSTGTLEISTGLFSINKEYCRIHPWAMPGDYLQLMVSDDGCGMSKEVLAHIFEPFYTTKGVDKGTGLGMATVYGIVKQNNGFIDVDSTVGQGTTIHIYFPQTREEVSPAATGNATAPVRADETLLLVEDEESLLQIAQQKLEEAGYRVIAVNNSTAALQLASKSLEQINLLLTDVIMPEMNGKELAEHLLALNPALKVLYMSGYSAEIISNRGMLKEGVELLQKPFSAEVLMQKLREVLDR